MYICILNRVRLVYYICAFAYFILLLNVSLAEASSHKVDRFRPSRTVICNLGKKWLNQNVNSEFSVDIIKAFNGFSKKSRVTEEQVYKYRVKKFFIAQKKLKVKSRVVTREVLKMKTECVDNNKCYVINAPVLCVSRKKWGRSKPNGKLIAKPFEDKASDERIKIISEMISPSVEDVSVVLEGVGNRNSRFLKKKGWERVLTVEYDEVTAVYHFLNGADLIFGRFEKVFSKSSVNYKNINVNNIKLAYIDLCGDIPSGIYNAIKDRKYLPSLEAYAITQAKRNTYRQCPVREGFEKYRT